MEDKVVEILRRLADKLGVASQYIWEALVREQRIKGYGYLAAWILGVIAVIVGIKFGLYFYKKGVHIRKDSTREWDEEHIPAFVWCISSSIVSIILTIVLAINIPTILGMILNPQYFALKDLMMMVHGK